MVQWGVVRCGSFVKRTVTRKRRKLNNFELLHLPYGPMALEIASLTEVPYLLDNFFEFNHGKKLKMVTPADQKKLQKEAATEPYVKLEIQWCFQAAPHKSLHSKTIMENINGVDSCTTNLDKNHGSSRYWTLQNKVKSGIGLPVAFLDCFPAFPQFAWFSLAAPTAQHVFANDFVAPWLLRRK